ncbi:MAG: hypothetical protein MUQ20_03990, partial [Deltaproteobacteria bacterium]|nr:hypothetical protein [Deltaproteobacteria bacterium]
MIEAKIGELLPKDSRTVQGKKRSGIPAKEVRGIRWPLRATECPPSQEKKSMPFEEMIEAKIGELLPRADEVGPAQPGSRAGRFEAGKKRLPDGIKPHQAQRAR